MKTVKILLAVLLLVQVITLGLWIYWMFFDDVDNGDDGDCPAEPSQTQGIDLLRSTDSACGAGRDGTNHLPCSRFPNEIA